MVIAAHVRWRLAALLLALLAGALLFWQRWTLVNCCAGPFPVAEAELRRLAEEEAPRTFYVVVEAPLAAQRYPRSYRLGAPPYSYYGALELGSTRLLVWTGAETEGASWVGELQPLSALERQQIVPAFEKRAPGRPFLRCRLNAQQPFRAVVGYTVVLPLVGLLVLSGWACWRGQCG